MNESTLTHDSSSPVSVPRFHVPSFLLAAMAFLLPIFLIPSASAPFQFSKVFLALGIAVLLLLLYVFHTMRMRALSFSFSWPLAAVVVMPVAYLIASVFSSNPTVSFFGYQLEGDTFGFIAIAAGVALTALVSATNSKHIFSALMGTFFAGCAVILFEALQLFAGRGIPFFLFASPLVNLAGSWNTLGIFMGLVVSLILVALEALPFSRLHQTILYVVLVLGVLMLVIINFNVAWMLTASMAFAICVYGLTRSFAKASEKKSQVASIAAGVVLATGLFFLLIGGSVASAVQTQFGIQTLEVRPSIQSTLAIGSAVYAKSPIFGSGPNTFGTDWLKYRPASIVATPFWDVAFSAGFASIPSAAVTGGILITLAWLFFAIVITVTALRSLISVTEDARTYFLMAATAIGSLYLLSAHFMYVAEPVISLLMFFFVGLFMASLRGTKFSRDFSIAFTEMPRIGFVAVLVMLVLSIGSVVSLYGVGTVYASALKGQAALDLSNAGNYDRAETEILSAISLSPQDQYYRVLSAVELARLNALVQGSAADAAAQAKFKDILTAAINASQQAVTIAPDNYANWLSRASVFASVVPLGISGAADGAKAALASARITNPQSPEVDFRLADIALALKDTTTARTAVLASLAKKADYTPAILLLAQVSLTEGKLNDAITAVQAAVVLDPQNSQLLYQLGLLDLQAKQYDSARDSFEKALAVDPQYANASFFLGQAYMELGRKDDALAVLTKLQSTNPDNATLNSVVTAIKAGKDPFTPAPTPDNVKTPTN